MTTVVLLTVSNIFMTFAWYGHLKFLHDKPLWITVLISWGIAFFEYCLMVPANRLGYGKFTGYELKIMQEVITLVVFVAFAWLVLGEKLRSAEERCEHLASFSVGESGRRVRSGSAAFCAVALCSGATAKKEQAVCWIGGRHSRVRRSGVRRRRRASRLRKGCGRSAAAFPKLPIQLPEPTPGSPPSLAPIFSARAAE